MRHWPGRSSVDSRFRSCSPSSWCPPPMCSCMGAGSPTKMRLLFRSVIAALPLACCFGQAPLRLTLADARRLAIQNNPQVTAASLTAAAAHQVPAQYHANFEPSLSGAFTTVGADNGTRLAAGGLNNPVVYDRIVQAARGQPRSVIRADC